MSLNIYCNPKLYIEGEGIIEDISGSVSFPGASQISSLKVTIPGIDKAESAMLNKEVKFYLNDGGYDSVPYFIGYIKDFTSSDTTSSFTAFDARCFLGGEYSQNIDLTDEDNYDGFTLGQFLIKHINDNVNTDEKTFIDTSIMNDTNPPVTMKAVRNNGTPYSIALELLKSALDDSDAFNMFDYEIGVSFTNNGTNLRFIKEQPLDKSSMTFSYGDGIKLYTYKKNKLPNKAVAGPSEIELYSTTTPRIIKNTESKLRKNIGNRIKDISTALVSKELLKGLIHDRKQKFEINLTTTKGHYLQIGTVVNLNVEEEFKGNHRIVSKVVSFSEQGITCNLKLNTRPLTLSNNDY